MLRMSDQGQGFRLVVTGILLLLAIVAGRMTATAQTPRAVLVEGTGEYSRPISTDSAPAQQFFDQGLRLTYGYHFPEAAASFQEALRHDSHPMIWWGLALATGPNPNSRYFGVPDDPAGKGRKAVDMARRLAERASETERHLIDALFVRYDTGTRPNPADRDQAYLEAMHLLAERYPGDADVLTLFADAVMTKLAWRYWDGEGNPLPDTPEALEVLEHAMEVDPDHPGANHLYIHLLEASPDPGQALRQADRLAELMPAVGHVVHMPSHIYLRTGDYPRAMTMNERSMAADQAFLEAWGEISFPGFVTYPLSATNHVHHAREFIWYTASMQGNYARAIETARTIANVGHGHSGQPLSGRIQRAVASVWLVHKMFGQWEALLAEPGPPAEGYPYLDGIWHYTRGSAYAAFGDLRRAREELVRLRVAASDPSITNLHVVANPGQTILQLAMHGLEGEIAQAADELDKAITALEAAVRVEDSLSYIEPPDWAQSMRLYLGAALLAARQPAEAESVYRKDLRWNLENGWALFGLWQSLRDQGRSTEAEEVRDRFLEAWQAADVTLEASRF